MASSQVDNANGYFSPNSTDSSSNYNDVTDEKAEELIDKRDDVMNDQVKELIDNSFMEQSDLTSDTHATSTEESLISSGSSTSSDSDSRSTDIDEISSDSDSTSTDTESRSSNSDSNSSESDSTSSDIPYKYAIDDNGRKWNVTFIDNKWKKRKQRGHYIQQKDTDIVRHTPSIRDKWRIIIVIHDFYNNPDNEGNKSPKGFRRHYINQRHGFKSWINKVSCKTIQRYTNDFHIDSENFKQLEKYIKKYPQKRTRQKKRFYQDPDLIYYGVCPIFEEFAVYFREMVAKEYGWRTVTWLISEMKRFQKHTLIMDLISVFMEPQERRLIPKLMITRKYIGTIMVCYFQCS